MNTRLVQVSSSYWFVSLVLPADFTCSVLSAIVKFAKSALKTDLSGKCDEFNTVPGCGLKSVVTRVDAYTNNNVNEELLNQRNRSSVWTVDQVTVDATLMNQFPTFATNSLNPEPLIPIGDQPTSASFEVLVGNREWMRRNAIGVPDAVDRVMIEQEDLGQTVVLCAINGIVINHD